MTNVTDVSPPAADDADHWSRRRLLGLTALGGAAAALAACDAVADSPNPDMLTITRATYGPTQAVIDRIAAIGIGPWLAEQLAPDTLDTSALDAKLAQLPALALTPVELRASYPDNDIVFAGGELQVGTAIRQLESPAQLYERMVEFWSDHFNAPFTTQVMVLLKVVEDREVIRTHALGTFRDLLVADATSPAMLYYLDNAFSSADSINENYARELLELHTVGVNGGYTETDVVNTAKLLTGWTIDQDTGRFVFVQSRHDSSSNPILGWTRPAAGSNFDHGVDFLHYLATHPSTAEFLATKLVRRFVSDDPDPSLVSALAATYLTNDTAIAPVLTQLFTHPTFLASEGAKLRRPFEQLIAMGRAVGANLAPTTDRTQIGQLGQVAIALGQPPFRWPAPNGYPDVAAAWLNTGGLLSRWNAAGDVATNTFAALQYDEPAIRAGLSGQTATQIVDAIADRVLHQPLTEDGRAVVLNRLGWNPDDTKDAIAIFFAQRDVITMLLTTLDHQYT